MKQNSTRLSLESLSERIVPSATAAQVGQSGIVNAIYIDDGSTNTGIDIRNSPTGGNGGSTVLEFNAIDKLNPRRTEPVQPTLPNLPQYTEDGVEQTKRQPSDGEQQQVDRLLELIRGLESRVSQIKAELTTLEADRVAQYDAVKAQQSRVDTMQQAYDGYLSASQDMKRPAKDRAEIANVAAKLKVLLDEDKQTLKALTEKLNATTAKINDLQNQLYQNQRKIVELQDAINRIRQRADKGYPQDALGVPDGVFDITKIGTKDGGFVDISVLTK